MTTLEIIAELDRCRTMLAEAEEAGCESDIHAIWSYIGELTDDLYNSTN